MNVKYRQQDAL